MSKLSLKELSKQYLNRDKPHPLLEIDHSIISGEGSILVKLEKLFNSRRYNLFQ